MTAILESYHTHAEGADKGWWGMKWHPAHFDEHNKEIEGTKWSLEVHNAASLETARFDLLRQFVNNSGLFRHQNLD